MTCPRTWKPWSRRDKRRREAEERRERAEARARARARQRVAVRAPAEDKAGDVSWPTSGTRAFDPAELEAQPETFRDAFYRGEE